MIEDPASGYLVVGTMSAILLVVSLFDRWLLIVVILALGIIGNQFQVDLNLRFDDQSISSADIAFVIGTVAAGLRLIGGARLDRMQLLWLGLTLVLFSAFVRGLSTYGLEVAANSYRYWFYLTAGTMFILSFPWPPSQIDRLARLSLVLAGMLAVTIAILWIAPDLSPLGEELAARRFKYAYENQRVVGASTALLLAQAGLIGLAAWLAVRPRPVVRVLGLVFLITSVLLYHRSVWGAAATGIVVLMILYRGRLHRLGTPLFLGIMLLVVSVLLGEGLGRDLLGDQIDSAIAEVLDDDSTLNWRVQGWEALLSRALAGGPGVWLFGAGFGVGYERSFGFYVTHVSPHNLYVELFLNAGLVGLALWLWFHARLLLLLYRGIGVDEPELLDRRMAIALVATMMAYCLPYSLSIEQSIWLGALAALAARSMPARVPGMVAGVRPV